MLRHVLMGLLARRPAHGYELRAAVSEMFGGRWDINVGQVYTTLSRLERSGLVESERVAQDNFPDRRVCSLTEAGTEELFDWLITPVDEMPLKQDLFAKILLHCLLDAGDPAAFIRLQRQRCLELLAQLSALETRDGTEPVTALLLEGGGYHIEADLRWLDRCEARIADLKGVAR
jgi:DNA-binding PadR family transcriptional regulator